MPLPLIPIISALAAGGTLVPHAAGGMIVTSAAGYVAGTYLSTAAIGGVLATASTALGAGALYLSGAAAGGAAGLGYGSYRLLKLKKKIQRTETGNEAQFTETEAKMIEGVIKRLSTKQNQIDEA